MCLSESKKYERYREKENRKREDGRKSERLAVMLSKIRFEKKNPIYKNG